MRRPNDLYGTSEYSIGELIKHVPGIRGRLLDPCNGKGNISKVLRHHFPTYPILTNDIDRELPAHFHFDAAKRKEWERFTYDHAEQLDWVITHPPFQEAFPILVHAYDTVKLGVAMILRLSFLEPTYDRQDWLYEHPPTNLIVLPRVSYTEDKRTDSVTTAWMVWSKIKPWNGSSIAIAKKGHR